MLYFYLQVSNTVCVLSLSVSILIMILIMIIMAVDEVRCVCAYPQVRSDYMQQYASKVSDGMALQLGCLEIR